MKHLLRNLLIIYILAISTTLFAQSEKKFKINGFIFDEVTGDPLPGANVYIKNGSVGDASDVEGYFEFEIEPGNYTIVYTYIGYKTVENEKEHEEWNQ